MSKIKQKISEKKYHSFYKTLGLEASNFVSFPWGDLEGAGAINPSSSQATSRSPPTIWVKVTDLPRLTLVNK